MTPASSGPLRAALRALEALGEARSALAASPVRTGLLTLCMAVGIANVIVVVATIDALASFVDERMSSVLSPKAFSVVRMAQVSTVRQRREWLRRPELTLDDAEALSRECSGCAAVGVSSSIVTEVRCGRTTKDDVRVMGVTGTTAAGGSRHEIGAGRPLLRQDMGRPMALLGADVADELFPGLDPLGQTVSIHGRALRVVGVLKRRGTIFGEPQDNTLLVPVDTLDNVVAQRLPLAVEVEGRSVSELNRTEEEVRAVLRRRHRLPLLVPDDFDILMPTALLQAYSSVTRTVYVGGALIAAIGVVVAAILVANVMLMAVGQRIREIGVRRSLGATRLDILAQLLAEAIAVTLGGAAAGVLAAASLVHVVPVVVAALAQRAAGERLAELTGLEVQLRLAHVALALVIGALAGVGAGLLPARRAAGVAPVVALRAEG